MINNTRNIYEEKKKNKFIFIFINNCFYFAETEMKKNKFLPEIKKFKLPSKGELFSNNYHMMAEYFAQEDTIRSIRK